MNTPETNERAENRIVMCRRREIVDANFARDMEASRNFYKSVTWTLIIILAIVTIHHIFPTS